MPLVASALLLALAAAAPTDVLLSLDAPVVSRFSGSTDGVTAAVADPRPGWVSTAFADVPEHALFPEHLDIDLGACGPLSSISIIPAPASNGGFPSSFTIWVGDAALPRWRLALNATAVPRPPPDAPFASFPLLPDTRGRYVRLSVTAVSGNLSAAPGAAGGPWAAVRRVQLYGPPPAIGACPAVDPSWPPPPPTCSISVRSISVEGLRADGDGDAMFIDTPTPTISWTLTACARGARVSAFRVMVGSTAGGSDSWDSNQQSGELSVVYAGALLRPATLFYVTLTLWDADGTPTPSAPARFTTAKLSSSQSAAWVGRWVGTGAPSAHRALYLRSSFTLPPHRTVTRAVASFVGLGYGELAIDGVKVGSALLAPGWTQYNNRTQYNAYDVTSSFAVGGSRHTLDIVLGDGWYAISADPWVHHLERAIYVAPPKALLDIDVTFDDGSHETYCTACNTTTTWEWAYGEITRAWIGAEDVDARLTGVRAWAPAVTVAGPPEQFPGSLLVLQVELPTRVQGEPLLPQLHTVEGAGSEPYIGGGEFCKAADNEMVYWVEGAPTAPTIKHQLDPGACRPCPAIDACDNLVTVSDAYLAALPTSALNFSCAMLPTRNASGPIAHVFDFGREFQGVVRVSLSGPAGANATIMPCGSMYGRCSAVTVPDETGGPDLSIFTLGGTGTPEVWSPRFMYSGIRTLVIKHDARINPFSVSVTGVRVAMDAPLIGTFACSDATHTWLHNAVVRTQENYVTGMPNDPTREKKGWTQDVENMAPTALLVHGASAQRMYTRWLTDVIDNQATSGALPEVAPGPVLDDGYNGAWWGGMGVWGPSLLYAHTGDVAALAPRYAAMRAYVIFLNGTTNERHDVTQGLGDWLAVSPACMHNATLINTPALASFAGIVADAATLLAPLGIPQPEDATLFAALARTVRDSYIEQYYCAESGFIAPGEQCTQALALGLALGLPAAESGSSSGSTYAQPQPFTPPALRASLEHALTSRIAADNFSLTTGFVTFPFMLSVLADIAPAAGQALLSEQSHPGPWLNSAGSGNDLCKEQWDGGDAEMPSLCGPLGVWSFASLAGLRPPGAPAASLDVGTATLAPVASSAGWRTIVIKPNVGSDAGNISWVDASIETPRGGVRVSWTLQGNETAPSAPSHLRLYLTIPPGATGVVHLPTLNAKSVLESGHPAATQPGVAFLTQTVGGRAVFSVSSGAYAFEADFTVTT